MCETPSRNRRNENTSGPGVSKATHIAIMTGNVTMLENRIFAPSRMPFLRGEISDDVPTVASVRPPVATSCSTLSRLNPHREQNRTSVEIRCEPHCGQKIATRYPRWTEDP